MNFASNKGLIYRIYKEHKQIKKQKTNNLYRKQGKDMNFSKEVIHKLGDSRQRSHTGHQHDSFGRGSCFASARARRFPVWSIRDGRSRLVPSPQGKQQLEALRTGSFTASTVNLGRSGSVGKGRPPKEN
ncbi:hypothetical protein AAY473_009683 [Plecturocebus cupreus]